MPVVELILSLYCCLILVYTWGWLKSRSHPVSHVTGDIKVTVIIPFKNEADNLKHLIADLNGQSYPRDCIQYVFVDDHSVDNSTSCIPADFLCVTNNGHGKKTALITGLSQAKGELILMLDADVSIGKDWLTSVVSFYEKGEGDLIILPVAMSPAHNVWGAMQCVEFHSLAVSTAGAALAQLPIMCNGANLAFKRDLVQDPNDAFNTQYVSGDDMFLLEYAKKKKSDIQYLKSKEAIAYIKPEPWRKFWLQRFRWTSKSGGYKDAGIIYSGAVVALINTLLLVLPFVDLKYALFALALKFIVDALLLLVSSQFWGTTKYLALVLIITPIYPLYALVSLIGGVVSKTWK